MDKEEKTITITMEEYKELLIIKGRYEELKERQNIISMPTYRDNSDSKRDYDLNKITSFV